MEKKVKLLIEIDEETYKQEKDAPPIICGMNDGLIHASKLRNAIANGIPITDDIISREALKEQANNLLDLAVKRVEDTPTNSPCYRMYVAQENERARFVDLIDNAPPLKIETK